MENTNKRNLDTLRRQGEVLLPAIAYGDAAGLPVETRTAEYIAATHGQIAELIPTKENPYFGSSEYPGTWSDDTQLSLAVAKALIKANGFDLKTMAETHLEAYNATEEIIRERDGKLIKRGWGGSTTGAMEKLQSGVSPLKSGSLDGTGNGVLMKMAPLAYWQAVRKTPALTAYKQYDQLTNLTHNGAIARMTTRIHGDVLAYLLREEYDKTTFLHVLEGSMVLHEFDAQQVADIELGYMRDQLKYLYGTVNKDTILAETDAKGFYAPQTLAMAYGAFMAHNGEFTPSVYEAVNLGGDTDSLASIVASMSVFNTKDVLRMPIDHQNLEELQELKSVSRQLAAHALQNL